LSGVAERKRRSEIHDATANLKRICKLLTVRPVWHPRLERAKMRTAATTLKASQKEPQSPSNFPETGGGKSAGMASQGSTTLRRGGAGGSPLTKRRAKNKNDRVSRDLLRNR
jgi:hypothetical protein